MDSTNFYQEKQDFQTALIWAQKALPQAEKEFGKDTNYLESLTAITVIFDYLGQLDSSIFYSDICLKISRTLFKGDNPVIAGCIHNLAEVNYHKGNYSESEMLYKEALAMRRRIFKIDNPDLAESIYVMANFLTRFNRYSEAEPLYKEALDMSRSIYKTRILI